MYRNTIAKALREELGTVELTKLTAGAAQKALANLAAGRSTRTVQMAHNVLGKKDVTMPTRYDKDVKAKTVLPVRDHAGHYDTEWAAIRAISSRLGMSAETLRQMAAPGRGRCGEAPGCQRRRCGRSASCGVRMPMRRYQDGQPAQQLAQLAQISAICTASGLLGLDRTTAPNGGTACWAGSDASYIASAIQRSSLVSGRGLVLLASCPAGCGRPVR